MSMKRLNYFKYQFLQEKDFKDEQAYHLSMRRLHNKELHNWGKISGLGIKFNTGESKVTIEPGMAIDKEGREIIVDNKEILDLRTYAGMTVYLVIAHKEQESDPAAQKEVTGNTRINESFQTDIYNADNPPSGWDKSLVLILAKITLNSDGAVNNVDYLEVTEATSKIGELKVPGIKLTLEDHGSAGWPGIQGDVVSGPGTGLQGIKIDSKKTTFTGDLEVTNNLTISGGLSVGDLLKLHDGQLKVTRSVYLATASGNVGIGKIDPKAKLDVKGDLKLEGKVEAKEITGTWDHSKDKASYVKIGNMQIAWGLWEISFEVKEIGTDWTIEQTINFPVPFTSLPSISLINGPFTKRNEPPVQVTVVTCYNEINYNLFAFSGEIFNLKSLRLKLGIWKLNFSWIAIGCC